MAEIKSTMDMVMERAARMSAGAGDEQDARALVDRMVPGRITAQIPAVFRLGNEDPVELAALEAAPDPLKNSLPRHGLNA